MAYFLNITGVRAVQSSVVNQADLYLIYSLKKVKYISLKVASAGGPIVENEMAKMSPLQEKAAMLQTLHDIFLN